MRPPQGATLQNCRTTGARLSLSLSHSRARITRDRHDGDGIQARPCRERSGTLPKSWRATPGARRQGRRAGTVTANHDGGSGETPIDGCHAMFHGNVSQVRPNVIDPAMVDCEAWIDLRRFFMFAARLLDTPNPQKLLMRSRTAGHLSVPHVLLEGWSWERRKLLRPA